MAYMDQERKARIAVKIKEILKKHGVKGSLSTDRSSISLNLRQGGIDFIANLNETCGADYYQVARGFTAVQDKYHQVNPYHYEKHFSGQALAFLTEALAALNEGNHNRSDIQSDYFDVGWYVYLNIGKWDKPYVVT